MARESQLVFRVEPEAKEQFVNIVERYDTNYGAYIRIMVATAINKGRCGYYSDPANKWDSSRNAKLAIMTTPEKLEQFKAVCSAMGRTPTEVLRGWVYKTIDLDTIWLE